MKKILINEIEVPKDRFGERTIQIEKMAQSLHDFGQLQPIRVEKNPEGSEKPYKLQFGFRRLCGAVLLKWDSLDAVVINEPMTEYERRRIELEENAQRLDLTWAEKCQAVAELHRLKSSEDKDWTLEHTAVMIGESNTHVSKQITVAKELKNNPDLANLSSLRGAMERVYRKRQTEAREAEIRVRKRKYGGGFRAEIIEGDARELITKLSDESVDAIITDPPFGIDLDLKGKGEIFDDSEQYADSLLMDILPEFYRVLKPDSWLIMFYDINKLCSNRYVERLSKWVLENSGEDVAADELAVLALGARGWLKGAGFDYISATPNLWIKPDKQIGRSSPRTNFVHAYDGFVLAAKGDARVRTGKRLNIFPYEVHAISERVHDIQKPTPLMAELCETVCHPGGLVLDPFCGSGSTGLGALEANCEFIGFEISSEYARAGRALVTSHKLAKEGNIVKEADATS